MDEHEQYPTLRELAESAEDGIEVPAAIVRELFADRDRLLADRPFQLAAILALTDERDRLRSVVDAARTYLALVDSTRVTAQDRQAGMIDLRRALRQLDESAVMGESATCPDCGNPLRFCDCPDRQAESWDAAAGEKP